MSNSVLRSIRFALKTSTELNRYSGSNGEVLFDSTKRTLRIFNGKDAGGIELLRADFSNALGSGGGNSINFGTKSLIAAGFTGNVTGQVSDITNHVFNSLSDVNVTGALEGQVLYFDGDDWRATTLASTFTGGDVPGVTNFLSITPSTSTSTGAVKVSGGIGIVGAVNAGGAIATNSTISAGGRITTSANGAGIVGDSSITGSLTVTGSGSFSDDTSIRSQKYLRFYGTANTNYVAFRAAGNVPTTVEWTLPASDGSANQVLTTNGAGVLGWANPGTGGGGGSANPGGSNSYVQFNDNNTFGGNANLTFNPSTNTLTVYNVQVTNSMQSINGFQGDLDGDVTGNVTGNLTGNVTGNVTSSGTSSFATANISGGAINGTAIGSSVRSSAAVTTVTANDTATFTKGTNSVSPTTGSVVVTGGVGISQNTYVGGSVVVNNNITAQGNITANSNIVLPTTPTQATHATNKQYVDSRAIAFSVALS